MAQVNKDFVLLCKELELYSGELAGIDGSFFRASASKESIHSKEKLARQLEEIEADIENYLQVVQQTDQREEAQWLGSLVADEQLVEKLEVLQQQQQQGKAVLEQMEAAWTSNTVLPTRMRGCSRKGGQKVAGYNMQCSIDDKHKLIVTHEVTNDGNDLQQLEPMAMGTREIVESEQLTVVSDAGYYNPEQIKSCVDDGITPYVAIPDKSKPVAAQGRFTRDQFQFAADN